MGVLAKLFGKVDRKVNIAMCGLDNAGKTSILNYLKRGEFYSSIATMGVNYEVLKIEKLKLSVVDLGGQAVFRQFWPTYLEKAEILIFVVDSSDITRLPLAKEIFENTIQKLNKNIPVLVLATKQDLPEVCSLAYIIHLFKLTARFDRTLHIQRTSAKTGVGIHEAFQWIYEQVMFSSGKRLRKKTPSTPSPILQPSSF